MTGRDTEREIIGLRLRSSRIQAGLTQKAAAERSGLTQSMISMAEKGQRRLSAEDAAKLFEIYGIADIFSAADRLDLSRQDNSSGLIPVVKTLAEKTGSERLCRAVDMYLETAAYILMRKLYLKNPHNTEKAFSVTKADFEIMQKLFYDESDKLAAAAAAADDTDCSRFEPDEEWAAEFIKTIREYEKNADIGKKDGDRK